jgi:hypothetical protein
MMKPYSTPGANRYCRLLPPSTEPTLSQAYFQALFELGSAMLDDGTLQGPESSVTVGYTYFGQFLDHDLTKDESSIDDALQLQPEQIRNHQNPRLDLAHLYGQGPFHQEDAILYDRPDVRLKTGDKTGRAGGSFDIPVAGNVPLVADDRAVENAILRQVTAVFIHLHNCAVEQFRGLQLPEADLFARARLQTVWQFQWLVCDDFLPRLLDLGIYDEVFKRHRPRFTWNVFSIPVEFSVAAMRFGHSMIRERYALSAGPQNDRNLQDLFAETLRHQALPPDFEIDWRFFFTNAGTTTGNAPSPGALSNRPIDTRITPSLHHLPEPMKRLFNPPSSAANALIPAGGLNKLPVRTLFRGAGLRLCSGQQAARALGESVLSERELTCDRAGALTPAGKVLRDKNMTTATPIWYYILRESEVRYNGDRIGPVGSRIVAETIYAALLHDPDSILNHPEAEYTKPPTWKIGAKELKFGNFRELFAAAPRLGTL